MTLLNRFHSCPKSVVESHLEKSVVAAGIVVEARDTSNTSSEPLNYQFELWVTNLRGSTTPVTSCYGTCP